MGLCISNICKQSSEVFFLSLQLGCSQKYLLKLFALEKTDAYALGILTVNVRSLFLDI
jgi:hypothetical protein